MGRLSRQVKPRHEASSPRNILGVVYLSVQKAQEHRRTL
jgi:hypothetical protein